MARRILGYTRAERTASGRLLINSAEHDLYPTLDKLHEEWEGNRLNALRESVGNRVGEPHADYMVEMEDGKMRFIRLEPVSDKIYPVKGSLIDYIGGPIRRFVGRGYSAVAPYISFFMGIFTADDEQRKSSMAEFRKHLDNRS